MSCDYAYSNSSYHQNAEQRLDNHKKVERNTGNITRVSAES